MKCMGRETSGKPKDSTPWTYCFAFEEPSLSYFFGETLLFTLYIASKELSLSYYIGETLLFTLYIYIYNIPIMLT